MIASSVCQDLGKKVGLLLVVALDTDPVAGADDRLEKRLRALRRHHLAAGVPRACIQADASLAPLLPPLCHIHIAVSHVAQLRSRQERHYPPLQVWSHCTAQAIRSPRQQDNIDREFEHEFGVVSCSCPARQPA